MPTTSTKSIIGLTTLNNEGVINVQDAGNLNITDGILNNQATGVIDIQADGSDISYTGSASRILNNFGTIRKTGTLGIAYIEAELVNTGTINVDSGDLRFRSLNKILDGGTYNVGVGCCTFLVWSGNIGKHINRNARRPHCLGKCNYRCIIYNSDLKFFWTRRGFVDSV